MQNRRYTGFMTFKLPIGAIACMALTLVAACAPAPIERQYATAKSDFGPQQMEAELSSVGVQQKSAKAREGLTLRGEVDSARVFRIAENLLALSRVSGRPELARISDQLHDAFYSASGVTTQMPFTSTPYLSAAIGETRTSTLALIEETRRMLAVSEFELERIIEEEATALRWAPAKQGVKPILSGIRRYLSAILEQCDRAEIDARVKSTLRAKIHGDILPKLASAELEVERVLEETRPVFLLGRFSAFLARYDVELLAEDEKRMMKALRATGKLDRMSSAQDALEVLIMFWEIMPPEQRKATYKPVSAELYGFLNGRSASQLDCLKDPDCHSLFMYLAKKIKILPALKDYGIAKLKREISAAVRESFLETVYAEVDKAMRELPGLVAKGMRDEIAAQDRIVRGIAENYDNFVRELGVRFATEHMGGESVAGVEADRVRVELVPGAKTTVAAVRGTKSVVRTGAEAIGASLALAAARTSQIPAEGGRAAFLRTLVGQVNKMLALGGFKTEDGTPFESFAVTVEPMAVPRHAYLRTFASNPLSFAVPDDFEVGPGFRVDFDFAHRVGVAGQAELLRGLSAMIRSLRDWETGVFDQTLGAVTIGSLVKELPQDAITEKFFPKDLLFAMSVGNAAVILQNMTKSLSSVLLLDQQLRMSWSNELDLGGNTVASMAALVDIEAGQRGQYVSAADVARFLIAVVDFLDATAGIELTRSSPLLGEKTPDQERPLDLLVDARRRLRLLVVGLANFLSHQMQAEDGGVRRRFSRAIGETVAGEPRRLHDQVLAMQALHRAGDFLDSDVYRWAARDVFAFMTRELWDPTIGFFRAEEGKAEVPDLEALTTTLLAIDGLRSKMSYANQAHWSSIFGSWLSALSEL